MIAYDVNFVQKVQAEETWEYETRYRTMIWLSRCV